jgi:hypothetical protein
MEKIGNPLFNEWIAFYSIEAEDEEKAIKEAQKGNTSKGMSLT